jgi:hypothetical protein
MKTCAKIPNLLIASTIAVSIIIFAGLDTFNVDAGTSRHERERVIFLAMWKVDLDSEVMCEITETLESSPEKLPERRLAFYRKGQGEKIYEFVTPDHPLNAFPTGEVGGRFFTSWTGGSAHHFYVFAYVKGTVKKVLESDSKLMPEFLFDKDGNEFILITHTIRETDPKTGEDKLAPNTTEIFEWVMNEYRHLKTVPWRSRLELMKKEQFR